MDGGPGAGRPVGVDVVRGTRQRSQQHEGDRHDQRDVGRRPLVREVEQDREQQRTDRDVGDRGVERVAEPTPVEQVLDRSKRAEQGCQPAMVEVAEGSRPDGLGVDDAEEQATQQTDTSLV